MTFPLTVPMKSFLVNGQLRYATLWTIERADGIALRFTDHNATLVRSGLSYTPISGVSASARQKREGNHPQNLEVIGVISDSSITDEDLISGKYRGAKVTETVVDWKYPDEGIFHRSIMWIAEHSFSEEVWEAQVVGLVNRLRRSFGDLLSRTCRWGAFGDADCGVFLPSHIRSGEVTEILQPTLQFKSDTSANLNFRRVQTALFDAQSVPTPGYNLGRLPAGPSYIGAYNPTTNSYQLDLGVLGTQMGLAQTEGSIIIHDDEINLPFDERYFNTMKNIQDFRDANYPTVPLATYGIGATNWNIAHTLNEEQLAQLDADQHALGALAVAAGLDNNWTWTWDLYWGDLSTTETDDETMDILAPMFKSAMPGGKIAWMLNQKKLKSAPEPGPWPPMLTIDSRRQIAKALQTAGRLYWFLFTDSQANTLAEELAAFPAVQAFIDAGSVITPGTFPDHWYTLGQLVWLSGNNMGVSNEIRNFLQVGNEFTLQLETPYPIQVGDTFEVTPGCDRTYQTCKDKFDNTPEFGGFPALPGTDEMLRTPDAKAPQ